MITFNTRQIGQLYRQAIQANPGDPPADKDPLKAENPKIIAKPRVVY